MSKKLENLYSHNRHLLHEVVPLDTPYSVNIEPASGCNIRCVYCMHSLPHNEVASVGYSDNYAKSGRMSEETFRLVADQLGEFPSRIKSITFGGVGEPLLHKNLPEMVKTIREKNLTERINLITNGLLFNEENAVALCENGLQSIKISLQGIDSDSYYKTCGCKIDFNKFLKNLDFLYKHKKQCIIGIKIADISLYHGKNSEEERLKSEEKYKNMFSDKCDMLGIERIVPCFTNVDYSKIEGMSGHKSRYDINERKATVCSQPFYRINIMQNGSVTLCTMLGLHEEWMNVHNASLKEIWDSSSRKEKLLSILQGDKKEEISKCQNCNVKNDFVYEEDNLDPYADEIIKKIMEKT